MSRLDAAVVSKYPYVLAVLVGASLLFFAVVFAVYVADAFAAGRGERLIVIATFLFAVYAVTGAFFGFMWPGRSWRWGVWVSVLPFVWSCFFRPYSMLSMLCTVVLPACAGSLAASRLRLRRSGASLVGGQQQTFSPDDSQTARATFLRR